MLKGTIARRDNAFQDQNAKPTLTAWILRSARKMELASTFVGHPNAKVGIFAFTATASLSLGLAKLRTSAVLARNATTKGFARTNAKA